MIRIFILLITGLLAASCVPALTPVPAENQGESKKLTMTSTSAVSSNPALQLPANTPGSAAVEESPFTTVLTHLGQDGNRLIQGSGEIPLNALDIPLLGKPVWIASAPWEGKSIWYVVLENGQVQAFQVEGTKVLEIELDSATLPVGMPPALVVSKNQVFLLHAPAGAANFTNPVILADGTQAYIDNEQHLRIKQEEQEYRLPVNALPDARILSDEAGRLLFLSDPTSSYAHDVLGDALEAGSITLIDTTLKPFAVQKIQIAAGDVIEGIAPIWADLNGDGIREVIVTQSNASEGARLVVYREDGRLLASGEPIGRGFRWMHQLAVAQFIVGGLPEIAVIRTPHIGGIIELYSLHGDRLEVTASLSGYSSHQIGSRNLDSALAADLNGDGQIELIVPDQAQLSLSGIQYIESQLAPIWTVPLKGKLSTNITAVTLPNGQLLLGVGTEAQNLQIWFP
jgi:hypothetical protein